MKLTTKNVQEVQEVPWGVYLWQMPDGSYVADGEGHFLMIAGTLQTKDRRTALAKVVKSLGIEEGQPCFFQGNRIVTDEEYEEQKLRLKFGLTPDKWDVAAAREDAQNARDRERGTY